MNPLFSMPLLVEEYRGIRRIHEPVTVGVPLPKGIVFDPLGLTLFDQHDRPRELQVQILARWFDDSIKWALLDFFADVEPKASAEYCLKYCSTPHPAASNMPVRRFSDEILVDTGHAAFRINTRILKPFDRIEMQGSPIVTRPGSRIVLTDDAAREYEPSITQISVDTEGPIRTTLSVHGKFYASTRKAFADFTARLNFYAQSNFVEVKFTLRNPRAAHHPGGLWDLGDEGSIYFKDLSLQIPLASNEQLRTYWLVQPDEPVIQSDCSSFEIYQDSSGGENWNSANHVNRFGEVMTSFRGFRVTADGVVLHEGNRANPIVSLSDRGKHICGAIAGFWQNFPKAIEVQHNFLIMRLFPGQYGDVHELQGGEQKTHTLFLQFQNTDDPVPPLAWVYDRLIPHTTPELYERSKAFSYITKRAAGNKAVTPLTIADRLIDGAVNGNHTFFDRREIIDEYGWRNFGDLYADHEAVGQKGERPLVAHYNNQYDVIYGAIIQYVRSGNVRWFQLLDDLAKHVIDIDIYHTQEDRPAFNGGMFWHTEHYTDATTATHRAYSKATLELKSRHLCGGGPSSEHNYTSGLLSYYCLTGDPVARDTVIGLADWVITIDNGSQSIFGIFDRRPTGFASTTVSRYYHGPGRGAGNSINALLDGYTLTRDAKYLSKAEQLIRRCIHPKDDIENRELHNIEHRWSYTVFLQTLGKYLDLKAENGEIDDMYGYARASLIHYAKWMLENEVPYKSVLDKVEIPTETWPAQDIRKSNVFKYAAKYASEPLRTELLKKSDFFFHTCLTDLLSFKTCTLTRPLVLLMTNAFMHSYFQIYSREAGPQPAEAYDFGEPKTFKPQLYELQKIREKMVALLEVIQNGGRRVVTSIVATRGR
jgi:hypothetical protein